MKQLLLIFCLLACVDVYSQTEPPLPDIIPLSPEAAGLGMYGEIPVTAYTGTSGMSIPLYTVKAGTLSLPIELSYHATGIKVDQEATWVGLGWNLIAGGAISYVPVGGNDQKNFVNRPWTEWSTFFNYQSQLPFKAREEGYRLWSCTPLDTTTRTPDLLITTMLNGRGEPDVYAVNFLNYSFKFMFHPNTGAPVFVGGKNKCRIERNSATSWTITGEDGTRYFFTDYETSHNKGYTTSWYLTGILSPEGRSIQFRYKTYGATELLPSISEDYFTNVFKLQVINFGSGCGPVDPRRRGGDKRLYTDDTYKIETKYLSEIETDNEIVRFAHGVRSDIKGASRKLDTLSVYSKLTSRYIKKYVFYYNYFNGVSTGGDYLGENNVWQEWYGSTYPLDFRRKRLKLDSLAELGADNVSRKTHAFKYQEQIPLPYKTSFARDLWGFYNGQDNASTITGGAYTLLPQSWQVLLDTLSTLSSLPQDFGSLNGANRLTSKNYITAGMLTEITYPTGGRTTFEYEPHTFKGRYKYFAIEDAANFTRREIKSAIDFNSAGQTSGFGFTVSVGTFINISALINGRGSSANYSASQLSSAYIRIIGSPSSGGTFEKVYQLKPEDFSDFDNTHLKQWQEAIFFNPGSYSMICYFPDALGGQQSGTAQTSGSVNYTDFNKAAIDTMESIGGGLRIKKMTNYSNANIIASTKSYSYTRENNSPSGVPMTPLQYYKKEVMRSGAGDLNSGNACLREYDVYHLSGSSNIPLSPASNGNYVGYDRVEIVSTGNGGNNGKEIQYFANTPATMYFSEIPVFENSSNGNMIRRIYLKTNGDTVKVENYEYVSKDVSSELINAKATDMFVGPTNICWTNHTENPIAYTGRFWLYAYPTVASWSTLSKQRDILYDGNNKITTEKEYSYSTVNYQQTEIKELQSDGKTRYTRLKYPEDFKVNNPIYTELVTANKISPVIEQKISLKDISGNERLLHTQKNNYSLFNAHTVDIGFVETANESNPLESRLVFHKRDAAANVLEESKSNGVHQCFIWDYNNTLPVAEVRNASYDQIAYTSFETDATGNWTRNGTVLSNGGITGSRSFNGTLSRALPASGNYVVTLWCNVSSSATVNGTAGTTVITKGNWKLLSWKLSSVSNIQVQGTNMDEVRLYPENALMTTYTYDPLIGMLSQGDAKNQLIYYEYDTFGRLRLIKDLDGKILKQYDYRYKQPLTQ